MPNETELCEAWAITLKDQCAMCGKYAPAYVSALFQSHFCSHECYDKMVSIYEESNREPETINTANRCEGG